jgi:hypothetical protein
MDTIYYYFCCMHVLCSDLLMGLVRLRRVHDLRKGILNRHWHTCRLLSETPERLRRGRRQESQSPETTTQRWNTA